MDFYKFCSEKLGIPFKVKYLIDSDFTFIGSLSVKKITKLTAQL